jgi:hypothetical protein
MSILVEQSVKRAPRRADTPSCLDQMQRRQTGGRRRARRLGAADGDGGEPVAVEIRRVPHNVARMAAAIRAAEGLPDHFARDIETGGAA